MRRDEILAKLNVRLPDAVSAMVIPALVVMFGLQCIRVLVSDLTWVLGDRFQFGAFPLGAIALAIFAAAFLAGPLRRRLGYRRLAAFSLGGLIVFRLFIQLWPGDPVFSLAAAGLAVACFVIFLPVYLDEVRHRENAAMPLFAAGFISGIILDTLVSGAAGTYDLAWQQTLVPIAITLALAATLSLLFRKDLRRQQLSPVSGLGSRSGAWLAVGPFIFLELVVFQNIPAQSALTGWDTGTTFLWLGASQLAGLVAAFYFHTRRDDTVFLATLFSAGLLLTFTFFPFASGGLEMVFLALGQMAVTQLFFAILLGMSASTRRGHFMSLEIANGIGMMLLVLFILGYYAVYQVSLPYENSVLLFLAAVLVSGGAMVSLRYIRLRLRIGIRSWLGAGLACAIALLPPVWMVVNTTAPETSDSGFPLKVLSYNLHNGFSAADKLDLEALARAIENSGADVIGLQEVSRGWLVSGRTDMLEWLSRRLGMSYYFGPTAGPLWGNAILSRYPIVSAAANGLPSEGLPLERGYISALIEVDGRNILVIDVHLHHVETDSNIRVTQVAALLDYYRFSGRTVIMGDFNAEPGSPEIGLMTASGLQDALAFIEPPPAFTFHAADPYQRIDYIWVSPDLTYSGVSLLTGTASDHFGVLATIDEP